MLAQTSFSETALQSAAIALGAAHYEYEVNRASRMALSNQRNLATILYIDAISKARHALTQTALATGAVQTGFILSFILAGIETLRDSKDNATLHLANGLKIAFSRGYDTVTTTWKSRESGRLLRDAVLALIYRLNTAIERYFDEGCDCDNVHWKSKTRHSLRRVFQELSNLIDHIMVWTQDPFTNLQSVSLYSKTLENCATTLHNLNLDSYIDRRGIRLLKLLRETAHLLLLCHINDTTAFESTTLPRCPDTDFESRSIYLRAYFSKLSMIEEQLYHDDEFIAHLTPASLKRFAIRNSLIYPWASAHDTYTVQDSTPLRPLYSEVEKLVMIEEDAIMNTNLVPKHAMCMEVISALEHGSVSIRYCVVGKDGESLDWVEKKALLWKPVVFI